MPPSRGRARWPAWGPSRRAPPRPRRGWGWACPRDRSRGRSPAGELGLAGAVRDERLHTDPAVVGGEQPGELQPLQLEAARDVGLEATVHGLLRGAQRE